MKLSIKQASTIYGSRFMNGSRNNIKSINLFLSILTPYFLDLKRKMEKKEIKENISHLNPPELLLCAFIKMTNKLKVESTCIFWKLLKPSRTLKNFLQIHIQLFHHRFILSINKFTILNR